MNKTTWQYILLIKAWGVLVIVILLVFIYFIIMSAPLRSFMSIIHHGDIIYYIGKSTVCVGGVPFALYLIFLILRALPQKDMKLPSEPTLVGKIFLPISIVIFAIFFIASLLIPFWLMFSGYHPCSGNSLDDYLVIDVELCKTIMLP